MEAGMFEQKQVGNYIIGDELGKGAFATVYSARDCITQKQYAVKVFPKSNLSSQEEEERFQREINAMALIDHPGIVSLKNLLWDSENFYLVMDYCAGSDLNRFIKHLPTHKGLSEGYAATIFKQIAHALAFCHSLGVVHRDLKPDNILITEFPTVKIADFGLCGFCKENDLFSTYCGSPGYCAPECLSMDGSYDGKLADIWSLGVILYFLVSGRHPWGQISSQSMINKIQKGAFIIPSYLSEQCQNLISGIMRLNPNERLTLQQIMDHPWVKSANVDGLILNSRKLQKKTFGAHSDQDICISDEILDSQELFNIHIPSKQSISINDLTKQLESSEHNHGIHSPFVTNPNFNTIIGSPLLRFRSISLQDIKEVDSHSNDNLCADSPSVTNDDDSSQSIEIAKTENEQMHPNENNNDHPKIPKLKSKKSERKKTKISDLNRARNPCHYSLTKSQAAPSDKMKFRFKSTSEINDRREEESESEDDIKSPQNTVQIPLEVLRNSKSSPIWKKHRSAMKFSRRSSQFPEYGIQPIFDSMNANTMNEGLF